MPLQFFLAQARRQRLREEHQIWMQEELKHLEHQEEVACKQIKGIVAEEVRREGRSVGLVALVSRLGIVARI